MHDPAFKVRFEVDEQTGEPLAAYFRIREGEVAETKEVVEGSAFADYDADGWLLGVELLAPCRGLILDRLTAEEPEPVKSFVTRTAPRSLVLA
jgi:hypothetical protein